MEKLEKRILIRGTITAETPLHIGSMDVEELAKVDMPILKDHNGKPYIPGSSLKGKVRSEAERIARASGITVCFPPQTDSMCKDTLCICCQIFGSPKKAGKIKFRDAFCTNPPERTIARPGIGMDRKTGTSARGALFEIEGVPAGTTFNFEIILENLTDEELKLFKAALKSVQDSALGGQSSRGFGKINVKVTTLVTRTAGYYLGKENEEIKSGEEAAKWLGDC